MGEMQVSRLLHLGKKRHNRVFWKCSRAKISDASDGLPGCPGWSARICGGSHAMIRAKHAQCE
eukprot:CAMPEP_0115639718 /NCGR_PEP_ID=MMETSP0272-20121206/35405_1 /TAXON_ID=71861 /ORGANISM="Scrippsiella trochoidea, Strain CCMP3099" /LENGTH=62 /DNA_ID=CAMNT_0003076915 /DNA_START=1439 /DNA_END=1625 /DNA_ORIENTATION=+